jgi:hypothetical protein
MMHKLLKVFVYPLIIVMFVSTQGISLFMHHCDSTGNTFYGLFTPASCDHSHNHAQSPSECCSGEPECEKTQHPRKCSDCCSDSFVYLKPDISALTASSYTVDLNPKLTEFPFCNINDDLQFKLSDQPVYLYQPKPPPKTGIFKLILFQSLKIPDILS